MGNISPYTRFIGIDCETSGINSWQHGILEIGAIVIDKFGNEIEIFNEYCNPGEVDYTDEAMKINKIPINTIFTARPIREVLIDFIKFMNKYINNKNDKALIVGNNFSFDISFFQYSFSKHIPELTKDTKWLFRKTDELKGVVRTVFPETEHLNQAQLGEMLDIPNLKAHSALGDIRQMLGIYRKAMMLNYQRIKASEKVLA